MKYESYKDSGVEWIGKVPSHWVVAAFKRKITINNGKDYKDFLDEEIYPVMGSGGCFAYCSKYMFDGEALLLGRKGTIDKPLYINGKFWAVDTMFYATPHKDLNCKFAYYLALTFPFQLYSTSTALPSMTQTDLGNNPVAFPPIVEQQAIALYLDKKCEEIDRAIDTQKKKIELLNELKQTIITNAVTKGLNPNAPMKDSGIAWIGKVPEHWEVSAFKRRITINNGKDYKDFLDEEIYPVMGSGGCFAYCSRYMYDGEALLLGRKGTIDKPLYIKGKFWAVDTMFYAIPHKDLNCKFAHYLSLTFPFGLYSTSTALPSMTQTDLGNNPVAFPPLEEQQSIVSHLDIECSKIERKIEDHDRKVKLLNELKQSIITEAVTGKIKVC